MLKKLRQKKTARKIWILLAILVVPAFVLWGSGSSIRSKQETTYAGKIFGKEISFLKYKDALEAVRNQAIMQLGDNFSEMQKYLNLENQAWERLILLDEVKKRKIKANNQEVIELIKGYPFFQKKGQFDPVIYSQILQYVFRTQPRLFEEQTRQTISLTKLYNAVTKTISLDDSEIKEAYRKENGQISIYYLASLDADLPKDITVTEEEIKDYFIKNASEFNRPPSFNLEYISLGSKDNETIIGEQINKIALRLNKKEDFAKVAGDFGLKIQETGAFTQTEPIPGIGWSEQILNLISKLKIGQYSPPIKLDKSYYILKLKNKRQSYMPDFEMIKEEAKIALIKNKGKNIAKEKMEGCLKKLKELSQISPAAANFEQLAKEFGLKFGATELFKYGSYIEGVGASERFWTIAQVLKEAEVSGIIDMPSGLYIIKAKSRSPIDENKFAAEKTEFAQKLLAQKKQEYFIKFVEDLKKKAQVSSVN
jgi:peptidyl-prolyl cis-trans isomerase D